MCQIVPEGCADPDRGLQANVWGSSQVWMAAVSGGRHGLGGHKFIGHSRGSDGVKLTRPLEARLSEPKNL